MDNLPAHKMHGVRHAIEAVGAPLMYPGLLAGLQPDRDGVLASASIRGASIVLCNFSLLWVEAV
jgi:hypothetical protein